MSTFNTSAAQCAHTLGITLTSKNYRIPHLVSGPQCIYVACCQQWQPWLGLLVVVPPAVFTSTAAKKRSNKLGVLQPTWPAAWDCSPGSPRG